MPCDQTEGVDKLNIYIVGILKHVYWNMRGEACSFVGVMSST